MERHVVEGIVADLAAYDHVAFEADVLDSMAQNMADVITAQDTLIARLGAQLRVADNHIADCETVIMDQLKANRELDARHRRHKWRAGGTIAGLVLLLILTNL